MERGEIARAAFRFVDQQTCQLPAEAQSIRRWTRGIREYWRTIGAARQSDDDAQPWRPSRDGMQVNLAGG